jgi:hypothetical protein
LEINARRYIECDAHLFAADLGDASLDADDTAIRQVR